MTINIIKLVKTRMPLLQLYPGFSGPRQQRASPPGKPRCFVGCEIREVSQGGTPRKVGSGSWADRGEALKVFKVKISNETIKSECTAGDEGPAAGSALLPALRSHHELRIKG